MTVVFDPTLTTDTRFEPTSQVHIQLLGSFHLLKAGQPVSTRGGGKTETLLARLALHPGRLVPRAVLLETLWPDCDTSAAGQSLNSLVYSLHKRLGDALHGATPVQQADGSYRLNLEAGVGVDVWYLEHLAEAGRACAGAGDRDHARSYYERAIQLYHGDL
jgi:DNA-binding SARP family transcriptional activator